MQHDMATNSDRRVNKSLCKPGTARIERTKVSRCLRFRTRGQRQRQHSAPRSVHDFAARHPERFWALGSEFRGIRVHGEYEPGLIQREQMPGVRWFRNSTLAFAHYVLCYRGDRPAVVFHNEGDHRREFVCAQLSGDIASLARALKACSIGGCDRIARAIIYGGAKNRWASESAGAQMFSRPFRPGQPGEHSC